MKFKPGNLLKNNRSDSLWLVLEALSVSLKGSARRHVIFKLQVNALCIQSGTSNIHSPGSEDTWFFKEPDGSDRDGAWTVINEV